MSYSASIAIIPIRNAATQRIEMTNFVYHGSPVQNLTKIDPRGHKCIYATKDKIYAALYIRRRGPWEFSRTMGHESGWVPFVVERYKSALDDFYKDVSGSLYVLDRQGFDDTEHQVILESNKPHKVIQEIKIPNIKDFLLDMEKQGKLKIYRYPNRPSCIPEDDSDLLNEILKLPQEFRSKKIQELKELFPDLYLKNKDKLENYKENICTKKTQHKK